MSFNTKLALRTLIPKVEFIHAIRKLTLFVFLFTLLISFVLVPFNLQQVDASTMNKEKLIERISKDYTNKFCNSIAFGLSKESAMNFAIKENNMIFEKKKEFASLDAELVANKIATSVVENCGYNIDLQGDEGINKFENYYTKINNLIVNKD